MHFIPIGPTSNRDASLTAEPDPMDYASFYTAYGECFAAWSGVEMNLFSVYVYLLRSPEYQAAAAAFYSTTGFRAKLDMVNAIVENASNVAPQNKVLWENLSTVASKKSRRRNELAHNVIYYGRLSDRGSKTLFVGDPRTPGAKARLHSHDLVQIRDAFIALGQDLFAFWQKLQSDG